LFFGLVAEKSLYLKNMITELVKILSVLGLSSTKFLMGTGLVMAYAYSFWTAFLLTFIGGMVGFFTFTFFSETLLNFNRRWRAKRQLPTFTKFRRTLVKIRQSCGLFSIALLTPIFLTVPVGAFMATSLTSNKKRITLYMTIAFLGWSLLFNVSYSWLGIDLQAITLQALGY